MPYNPVGIHPKRVAYADPPYLGCGNLYADKHPNALDWDKPKRHRELIISLYDSYDGWALSCSSPSLKTLLGFCDNTVRVAAWVKPFTSFKPNVNPAYAWEPVIFRPCRTRDRAEPTIRDWVAENITLQRGLTGAKPRSFCLWMFDLIGARKGDDFHDLFPGTGAVGAAWQEFTGEHVPLELFPVSA
jgi:hypothetical protein